MAIATDFVTHPVGNDPINQTLPVDQNDLVDRLSHSRRKLMRLATSPQRKASCAKRVTVSSEELAAML